MDNRNRLNALKPFIPGDFYTSGQDPRAKIKDSLPYVKLTVEGIQLVSDYYSEKYNTKPFIQKNSTAEISAQIKSTPEQKIENRDPFILRDIVEVGRNRVKSSHSTPIAYVAQGKEKAIIIFDSLGGTDEAEQLHKQTGLPVITIRCGDRRQTDYYSCHADALVFLREILAKDENNNYRIPNIISFLTERTVKEKDGFYNVLLPDIFVKTSQLSSFTDKHRKNSQDIVHHHQGKPETLEQFLKRYPEEELSKSEIQPPSSYIRKKGLKYADVIEIQFYSNQMRDILKDKWTKTLAKDFAKKAKVDLASQGIASDKRAGLLAFSQQFLAKQLGIDLDRKEQLSKTTSSTSSKSKTEEQSSRDDVFAQAWKGYRNETKASTITSADYATNLTEREQQQTSTVSSPKIEEALTQVEKTPLNKSATINSHSSSFFAEKKTSATRDYYDENAPRDDFLTQLQKIVNFVRVWKETADTSKKTASKTVQAQQKAFQAGYKVLNEELVKAQTVSTKSNNKADKEKCYKTFQKELDKIKQYQDVSDLQDQLRQSYLQESIKSFAPKK